MTFSSNIPASYPVCPRNIRSFILIPHYDLVLFVNLEIILEYLSKIFSSEHINIVFYSTADGGAAIFWVIGQAYHSYKTEMDFAIEDFIL